MWTVEVCWPEIGCTCIEIKKSVPKSQFQKSAAMKDVGSRDYLDDKKDTQIAVVDNCDNSSTNNKLGKDSTIYTIYGNGEWSNCIDIFFEGCLIILFPILRRGHLYSLSTWKWIQCDDRGNVMVLITLLIFALIDQYFQYSSSFLTQIE